MISVLNQCQTYLPHIATVIQEGNAKVASGKTPLSVKHINLESIMVSNPLSVSNVPYSIVMILDWIESTISGCFIALWLGIAAAMLLHRLIQ